MLICVHSCETSTPQVNAGKLLVVSSRFVSNWTVDAIASIFEFCCDCVCVCVFSCVRVMVFQRRSSLQRGEAHGVCVCMCVCGW